MPTLVVAGVDDRLAGPPQELAALIPGAEATVIVGNHLTAVAKPLAAAIVDLLARGVAYVACSFSCATSWRRDADVRAG